MEKIKRVVTDESGDVLKDVFGAPIVFEVDRGYEIKFLEIPEGFEPDEFFKSTEEFEIRKPYPNEHSCPQTSDDKYDKYRRGKRNHDGKQYGVIYGRVRNTNKWESVSLRYPKSDWSASEARTHCKSHGGVSFEAAVSKDDQRQSIKLNVMKKDDMRHLVYGIVLEPNVVDIQNDVERPEEIEKAAHKFLLKMWNEEKREMIGAQHEYPIPNAIPVESYIAPTDFWYEGTPLDEEHMVAKGSWVLVSLIVDDEEFEKVKTGVYQGYSIQGKGERSRLDE